MAERFAQCEIFAVGVDDRAGPFEAETARGRVDIIGIDLHGDHLGQKHVVRTQLKHLPHAALDAHGRLFDDRRGDLERLAGRKAHFAEFVVIAARTYAAPVRGTGQTAGREVDDELAGAADNPVGVAFGPHRDVDIGGSVQTVPVHATVSRLYSSGVAPQLTSTAGSG